MKRGVSIHIRQLMIGLLLQSLEKCLLPPIYRRNMQNILSLRVRNAQAEPFLLKDLRNLGLILEIGEHQRIAFQGIALIEHQVFLEGDVLDIGLNCLLVTLA